MGAASWTRVGRAGVVALLGLLVVGCLQTSWGNARRKDSVAAYHNFLRMHPGSWHSGEAHERIAFLRVRAHPSVESYQTFVETYPESPLKDELNQYIEPRFFEHARDLNVPAAYRDFLQRYPNSKLSVKAKGNLAYVESVQANPSAAELQRFVTDHPDSDFAIEARASLELLRQQQATRIRRLAVRVDVATNVGQAKRVQHGFTALVAQYYHELGVQVTPIPAGSDPPPHVDAWMRIDYKEVPASGTFGGRTLVSQCRVRLYQVDIKEPIWDRSFEAPADHIIRGAYGRDKTVFANSTYRFWKQFFVPVSTWATSLARVHHIEYPEEVSAIDIRGNRAVVLYSKGSIDYLDVSTPLEPRVIDRYRRERDLSRWTGIELLTEKLIVSFGPDGIELIELGAFQPKRLAQFELPEVGSIAAADLYRSTLLFAGTQGVFALRLENWPLRPQRLLEGEFVGLFVRNPHVYLVRPEHVELTNPKHLMQHLSGPKLALGKGFGARRARIAGDSMYVLGKDDTVEVRLSATKRPKLVSKLPREKIGRLTDLTSDAGHLYLLGERGLGVAGPGAQWVSDFIQVDAGDAVARRGRFLFVVGGRSLEVLDMAPYQASLASPQD